MVPRMNVVQRLLQLSPVSFKQPPKTQTAPSSTPYRICSSRKATKLPPKPTRHQAKPTEPLINYGFFLRMWAMEYGPDAIERDSHARATTFRDFRTVVQQHRFNIRPGDVDALDR